MGMCEGNWRSQVKWDKQNGEPPADKDFVEDGILHVCPYANGSGTTKIKGEYISAEGSNTLEESTCEPAGEGRFKVKAQWKITAGGKTTTFHYEGNARMMNTVNGPTFIYGTVKSDGGADSGAWEAIRFGPVPGAGPGEGQEVATSDIKT